MSGPLPLNVQEAEAAYAARPEGSPSWAAALLARNVASAHFRAGALWPAMSWCVRSWDHTTHAMRTTGGFATAEIMDSYDSTAVVMARIYHRLGAPSEIRRLIDDLAAVHAHGRRMLKEWNETSLIPLAGPTGEVRSDDLAEGTIAAILASAESGGPLGTKSGTDALAECEAALASAGLEQDAAARLALADAALARAGADAFGLCWRDLMIARARALRDLGRMTDACEAAEWVLDGNGEAAGAFADRDWPVAAEAAALLREAGRTVSEELAAALEARWLPPRASPRKPDLRRPPAYEGGRAASENYHAAALRAVQAHETDGTPFVLYLRKFDIDVLHGPFEQGPKLIENLLRDALPPTIEVITVQGRGSPDDFGRSRLRRDAPALRLLNSEWAAIVEALIASADLIVSEPVMLGEGVRAELEMIFRRGLWDRTVLLLPPLDCPFPVIDSESVIQLFPRCVWADELHGQSFADSAMVADLIDRVRAIADLPLEERRLLTGRDARDAAFPVDMTRVAASLEMSAKLDSLLSGDDPATRYYSFWRMFRAAGIRGALYSAGDQSAENRTGLAQLYLEMSEIMLGLRRDGDRIIVESDPADCGRLLQSAFQLVRQDPGQWAEHCRQRARDRLEDLARLEQAMLTDPDRFEVRLLYGPLATAQR